MSVPEQRQDQAADVSASRASGQDTTPRIMVGTWSGELAVVEARTGRVCWLRRTKREPGAFRLEGDVAVSVSGMPFAVRKQINSPRMDEMVRYQIHVAEETAPAQLKAYQAGNGRLLWTYAHPQVMRRLYIEADAGTIVTASDRHIDADAPVVQAFDALAGTLLWERRGGSGRENIVSLQAAHGGRLYARLNNSFEKISAFDIRSGRPLWERPFSDYWVFSPGGGLIGEHRAYYSENGRLNRMSLILIDARDGSELASIPTAGVIRHLTDDGIAYVDGNTFEDATWIAAVNARAGEELWRAPDTPHEQLALDGAILAYRHGVAGTANVEVGALDAATGERLWQWRSPGSLSELLRLWGPDRIPLMLWDSTEKSVTTLAAIVGRPWFHLRRQPSRFRIPPRQRTLGVRLRDIRRELASSIGWPLWQEFSQGHWRHPWQSHGGMNADWLAARWGIVFLGTWLGLFALDARDGRLLWHALPTLDLSFMAPALAP